jgi:hypothetical protein
VIFLARDAAGAQAYRVKRSAFFIASLLVATSRVLVAQTPSATSAPSNWQLGPPFELGPSPPLSSPAISASPASTATIRGPVVQSTATPPMRDRNVTTKPPYVEGSVWFITFIKTKSGFTDDYLKSIAGSLKPLFEEEKKQRLILDYKILTGDTAAGRDFNVILMVEYPNMAALDSARESAEPIVDKIIGPTEKRRDLAMQRADTREILATKTMREIRLK